MGFSRTTCDDHCSRFKLIDNMSLSDHFAHATVNHGVEKYRLGWNADAASLASWDDNLEVTRVTQVWHRNALHSGIKLSPHLHHKLEQRG
jgi:hypothetical protein